MNRTNPYQSPQEHSVDPATARSRAEVLARATAQLKVRTALLLMVLPAVYNFVCYVRDAETQFAGQRSPGVAWMPELIAIAFAVVAIWFWGLALLEWVTRRLHLATARHSDFSSWLSVLYEVLDRLPTLAFFGALLWGVWTLAFYGLRVGFYLISVPVGIVAHVLGALLYVPLFHRWYRLERDARNRG